MKTFTIFSNAFSEPQASFSGFSVFAESRFWCPIFCKLPQSRNKTCLCVTGLFFSPVVYRHPVLPFTLLCSYHHKWLIQTILVSRDAYIYMRSILQTHEIYIFPALTASFYLLVFIYHSGTTLVMLVIPDFTSTSPPTFTSM